LTEIEIINHHKYPKVLKVKWITPLNIVAIEKYFIDKNSVSIGKSKWCKVKIPLS
jgi:hypothetical protein